MRIGLFSEELLNSLPSARKSEGFACCSRRKERLAASAPAALGGREGGGTEENGKAISSRCVTLKPRYLIPKTTHSHGKKVHSPGRLGAGLGGECCFYVKPNIAIFKDIITLLLLGCELRTLDSIPTFSSAGQEHLSGTV